MLLPKRVKHRKQFKARTSDKPAKGGTGLDFGDFGLQAIASGRMTSRQIEAARRAMTRYVKRGGKIWIRVFPHTPVTSKPAETRMGKGKGSVDRWVAIVRPGFMLYEMQGVPEDIAREAMRLAAAKLPFKTKFVVREGAGHEG